MDKILVALKGIVLWVVLGVVAGLLYWIGHFNGYRASDEKRHIQCQTYEFMKFKGDVRIYGCMVFPEAVILKKGIENDSI